MAFAGSATRDRGKRYPQAYTVTPAAGGDQEQFIWPGPGRVLPAPHGARRRG